MQSSREMDIFLDIQRGLPRQGIGSAACTRRALELCRGLPAAPDVLDIGCGPGMQTITLAQATSGAITAIDFYDEFLDQLRASAAAESLSDRITVRNADMANLPFPPDSFDLLWCEGAAYILGIPTALATWRPLLRRGGCIALSEMVWLAAPPPAEIAAYFATVYPALTDMPTNLGYFDSAGYELLGHFTLPDHAWWDDYYTPLAAKLPAMRAKYARDDLGLRLVAASEEEIEMRRRFSDAYGYEFFVARKRDK